MNADEYVARLKIQNPLRPDSFFMTVDDLDEYAYQLWLTDAEYRAKNQEKTVSQIVEEDDDFRLFCKDFSLHNQFYYMDIDSHIAKLRIPDPYKKGGYFNSLQELGEYACKRRPDDSELQRIIYEPIDTVENGFLIVDKTTGEIVAESNRNPFEPHSIRSYPRSVGNEKIKKSPSAIRRFLSWIVLLISARIVYAVGYGIIAVFLYFLDWLGNKSKGISIFFSWLVLELDSLYYYFRLQSESQQSCVALKQFVSLEMG